jgi:hypothetical protein
MQLGRMWRNMMRRSLAPYTRAASTYKSFLTVSTCPRISRAYQGHQAAVTAIMALVKLGPSAAAIASASTRTGNAREKIGEAHEEIVGLATHVARDAPQNEANS